MFAQGQLLGMQSDLLNRLKTEINAWDKVAEKHPYSVYRRNDYPAYVAQRIMNNTKNGQKYGHKTTLGHKSTKYGKQPLHS